MENQKPATKTPAQTWRNRAAAFVATASAAVPAFAIDASDVTGALDGAEGLISAGFGVMVVVVGGLWAGRKVLGLLGR